MAADALIRRKIFIGLGDQQAGEEVSNVVRHTVGDADSLAISPGTLSLGLAAGTVGSFGATGSVQVAAAAVTDVASLKTTLQAFGLVAS